MPSNIQSLLAELYEIDPSLRDHERELVPIIEMLLKNNPTREPDQTFVEELRSQLRNRAIELTATTHSTTFSLFSMQKMLYAFSGALVAVVVAVPAVYLTLNGDRIEETSGGTPLFSYSVTDSGREAFNLSNIQPSARGQGGGGGGAMPAVMPTPDADMQTTPEGMDKMISPSPLYPPNYVQYQYSFSGSLPELPGDSVSVFKRQKNLDRMSLQSLVGNLNLGFVNLDSFGNANVDSLSFYQNTDFGYMGTISLREGTFSLYQNWEKWPHPESGCADDTCWQRYRTNLNEVLSDEEAIRIATEFVNAHNIDISRFGQPEVDNYWRREYDRAAVKTDVYIPDTVRVIFPMQIEGEAVYEEGGNTKAGISVNVSNKQKRVSDVYGVQSQQYLKSEYAGVTDTAAITELADRKDNSILKPSDICFIVIAHVDENDFFVVGESSMQFFRCDVLRSLRNIDSVSQCYELITNTNR